MTTVAAAQSLWRPQTTYLNTASYGLPPEPAWEALQAALADWRGGRVGWGGLNTATEPAREQFARMVGADMRDVVIGANVSGLVGLVAAALPAGTRVLAAENEFTSLLFPFLAQGLDVSFVPLARLAEAIDGSTDVVAVSAVQSSSGELAALDDIAAAGPPPGARPGVGG